MARIALTHLYDTYAEATSAIQALEANGVAHADVSIVSNDPGAHDTTATGYVAPDSGRADTETGNAAGSGATLGTVVGGGAGLLAGLGALAIPGVGPVVAAGWLIATLTGAGAGAGLGGVLGSLVGHGVHHDDAQVYSEGVSPRRHVGGRAVRRGGRAAPDADPGLVPAGQRARPPRQLRFGRLAAARPGGADVWPRRGRGRARPGARRQHLTWQRWRDGCLASDPAVAMSSRTPCHDTVKLIDPIGAAPVRLTSTS